MIRFWLGTGLLAASWLFGVEYFFPGHAAVWCALVALGTISLVASQDRAARPELATLAADSVNKLALVCGFALLPMVFFLPWPYRIGPVLLGVGAFLGALPLAGGRLAAAAAGVTISGVILLVQAVALWTYAHGTARSRELPWPLPDLLTSIVRLFGVAAGTDGSHIILPTMRENHRLATTWEFLLDPATFCCLAGALAALVLCPGTPRKSAEMNPAKDQPAPPAPLSTPSKSKKRSMTTDLAPPPRRWPSPGPNLRAALLLLVAAVLWLPLRAGLAAAVLLHRALRTEYEAPLNLMNLHWSPWTHLVLLLPLVLLAALWTRRTPPPEPAFVLPPVRPGLRRTVPGAVGCALAAAVAVALAVHWDPIGTRKPGRIAIDEFHSKWEPTDRPMDTEWYGHLSGYNYASLYDYCSHLYAMSRLTNTITDAALAALDVLVVKVPTERFAAEEIDAIVRFVERGGGLLMIGEHTDVFNTGLHLNAIARRFGFAYRYDCLFGTRTFFDQSYRPPVPGHPVLRYLRNLDFATSCSIDTGRSRGRGVIVSAGLKNSLADYHANNYYPQAVDHAGMHYGAFVQLWSVRHGRGRILAFTDSTIFSNFSAFEPGKIELFTGMLEWLNREDRLGNPRWWLLVLSVSLAAVSARLAWRHGNFRLPLVVAGSLGWTLTSLGLMAHQQAALPKPAPLRPWTWVTIDRTICDTPLSKGGFIAGKPDGFGIFERWILRLGYFIERQQGLDALRRDATVFFQPTQPVAREFRDAVTRYVENGGRILIIDSPRNTNSTASVLLESFGLSQKPLPGQGGTLTVPADWPAVPVEAAHEITGGRALFRLDGRTVGAVKRHGKGAVVLIGFGSRFADSQMGGTGDVVPDAALRKVFDLQFALLRGLMEDKLEELALTP